MNETLLVLLFKSVLLSAFALAVLGLLRQFGSQRVSAAARHAISLAGFATLALLPLLSASLPAWRVVPVASPRVPTIPTAPLPPSEGEKGGVRGENGGVAAVGNSVPVTPVVTRAGSKMTPVLAPRFSPSEGESGAGGIAGTIITVYATIAVLFLLRIGVGHATIWRIVRRARLVDSALPGAIAIRESVDVAVPLTVGWGRGAVIVLPTGFGASVPAARWDAVLAHETAHVRRADYVWQTFADVVCAVYFANPFVWLLAYALRNDAERAADDRVLADNRVRPSDYAAHLLDTARELQSGRGVPTVAVTMARRSEVGTRIGAVLEANVARAGHVSVPVLACLGGMGTVFAGVVGTLAFAAPPAVVAPPLIASERSDDGGGGSVQIAPGLFAEIGHITRREVRWLADGTRVAYTPGLGISPDTFGESSMSGAWLLENGKPSKRYAELEVYTRLRATGKKPARKMRVRIDRSPLTGAEKTDVKATVLFGAPVWKLGRRATVSPVSAAEYERLSAKQPVSGPWRDGAVVKTTLLRKESRESDRLIAIDSLGKSHPANATQYHKTNTDKTLLVANFNGVPGRIREYRWGRDVQERREIVFRGVALTPKPPATADSVLGEGRIPFYTYDMRRGQSIVLAKDAQGGETRLTFEKASIGNADVDWRSTRVSSVSLRWRVQVPPGVSPTLGGRPVLLLKKGRVQLPYGVGGISERMPEGTTQENTRDFHVAPAEVIALIYVPENTPFPGNNTSDTYPAPAAFQPPKSTWQGRGMFRSIATIPFAAGRTFRATANGNVVAFTVQVAPETDPSWTMGRKTSPTAIVQTHDTGSEKQERRLLLIEKDGTVHEMMYGSFPVLNFVLDDLGAKAIGEQPVYADTANGYKNWQSMTAQFPKAWVPRLKEIRLEARPRVEVPYTE